MRRAIIAAATVTLLVTGCSSSNDTTSSPKSTATNRTKAPPKLSSTWTPKLEKATSQGTPSICKTVGSSACNAHLTKLTEAVYAVETAIDEAGAEGRYPESVTEIRKVTRAVDRYVEDDCEGKAEPTLGSTPCAKHTQGILAGPARLSLTLGMDENEDAPGR